MEKPDAKKGQDVVPSKTKVAPLLDADASSYVAAPEGKSSDVVTITVAAKKPVGEDKKKMPRGSTAFRRA